MFSRLERGSTSAQRVAELDAETMRRKGMSFAMTDSRGGRRSTQLAPQPRKGFQNLGFDGVLSSLSFAAERKGAAGGKTVVGKCGLPRARCALAMTWFLHEVRCKPGFKSSGRPTPVRRLPIDYRGEICTSPVWADRAVRPCKFIMTPYTISPTAFCSAHRCYALPGPHSVPGPDRR